MAILEDENVRLRPIELEKDMGSFLEWYTNPDVLFYSEGPKATPYNSDVICRMCAKLSELGEAYIIEVKDNVTWKAIGDASITRDKTHITIGAEEYWGKGIGTRVLGLLIGRARQLKLEKLRISGINEYNARSLKLYTRAGFKISGRAVEDGYEIVKMELEL